MPIHRQSPPASRAGALFCTYEANFDRPDLFAAVEQQPGLRLESKKESPPILVVDHVDRVPTEN